MVNAIQWDIDRSGQNATGTFGTLRFYVDNLEGNEWRVTCDSFGLYKRYNSANIRTARRRAVMLVAGAIKVRIGRDVSLHNALRLASRSERVNNG
jgi:hypothetical protein